MTDRADQPIPSAQTGRSQRGREVFILVMGVIIILLGLLARNLFGLVGVGMVIGAAWRLHKVHRLRGGAA